MENLRKNIHYSFINIISKQIESRISQHSDFLDTYLYPKFNCVFPQEKKKCCSVMDYKQKTSIWLNTNTIIKSRTFTKEIIRAIKRDSSNQFISIYKKKTFIFGELNKIK